jgi:toxin ParE1/3/4
MRFRVRNLPAAELEAVEAAIWYDKKSPGLGARFFDALDHAAKKLETNAEIFRIRYADVRRISLPGFPFYGAYYVIRGDEVWVISIHHGRRNPASLLDRRSEF